MTDGRTQRKQNVRIRAGQSGQSHSRSTYFPLATDLFLQCCGQHGATVDQFASTAAGGRGGRLRTGRPRVIGQGWDAVLALRRGDAGVLAGGGAVLAWKLYLARVQAVLENPAIETFVD